MSEHREGTLFYDTETGRYDIRFDLESFLWRTTLRGMF